MHHYQAVVQTVAAEGGSDMTLLDAMVALRAVIDPLIRQMEERNEPDPTGFCDQAQQAVVGSCGDVLSKLSKCKLFRVDDYR